jgi:Transglycosylase-like domain
MGGEPGGRRIGAVRVATLRRAAIGVVAVLAVVWPAGGGAHSATPAPAGMGGGPAPNRHDAVAVAAPADAAVADATDRVASARARVDELRRQLAALHTAAYQERTEVLPVAAADSLQRTRAQRYADDAARAFTVRAAGARAELADAEREQQEALAAYFAALAATAEQERITREQEAARASAVAGTVAAPAPAPASTGSCVGDLACFLACTRAHESDSAGGYAAVSPDGIYRGAYQFDQSTWNSVADSIGRGDLVGISPAAASASDQDTLAAALYRMRGNQPWGGRC